jgi:hypothetical protein
MPVMNWWSLCQYRTHHLVNCMRGGIVCQHPSHATLVGSTLDVTLASVFAELNSIHEHTGSSNFSKLFPMREWTYRSNSILCSSYQLKITPVCLVPLLGDLHGRWNCLSKFHSCDSNGWVIFLNKTLFNISPLDVHADMIYLQGYLFVE